MLNEKQLRELLVSAFERLKEQQNAIFGLTIEVAALRESLCKIGPGYDDLLSKFRVRHSREFAPATNDLLRQYDEIIRKLKSGGG